MLTACDWLWFWGPARRLVYWMNDTCEEDSVRVMAACVGATVTLRMTWTDGPDGPPMPFPPTEDLYLVFEGQRGPGAAYVILDARPMTRSPKPHRYALRCMKIAMDNITENAAAVPCYWHGWA